MATSAGEVEVKLSLKADDFKNALSSSQQQMQGFSQAIEQLGTRLLAVFSFAAIGDFFKRSLDAYAENQLAVTRLIAALNNQGTATEENVNRLKDMALALSQSTGASKDAIINAQTLLTTFGIQGETMDKVVKASLDLSAATGVDLQRAVLLLGKAYEGQTNSLSRYGIVVNQHIDINKRFAAVMDQVNQRFGGAAEAQANTYIGRLNIMKQSFENLQEQIGEFLAGPASGLLTMINNLIKLQSDALKMITDTSNALGGFGNVMKVVGIELIREVVNSLTQIINSMLAVLSHIPLAGSAVDSMKVKINDLNKSLNAQIDSWQGTTQTAMASETKKQSVVLQTKEVIFEAQDLQTKYVADKMAEEVKLRQAQLEEDKKSYQKFGESFTTTQADLWKEATTLSNDFFKGLGDSWAKMVVEGKSFGESIKQVFNNLKEAVLSYIAQMMAKMLALYALKTALGVGFGGPAAATPMGFSGGLASGMMGSGGVIGEPSIVTGLKSGRSIIAGESGPEMVVPMGKNMTADEMGGLPGQGGSGGGGSITINISGQFLEADSAKWNQLMRDQIIPQIRRFTMISSTGPFNRTRGLV